MTTDSTEVVLDFEKNIVEIEEKIEHLQELVKSEDVDITKEIKRLQHKLTKSLNATYHNLTAWQKTQIARHPQRPHCLDYIKALITDFVPLCGDRRFGEDEAMIAGIGKFEGVSVVVIGQEKGHDLETRMKHNFGMAKPEGYRKAQRLMDMASRFNMPVLSFVDTAGAYPGMDAEERGQAEAIAASIEECFKVKAPIIATVIGEGGSGGAIAIATANVVMMLEHSIYSVISPEGCASILWRDASRASDAADALKITAPDLMKFDIIDGEIKEPLGGAHVDYDAISAEMKKTILNSLDELSKYSVEELKNKRYEKFRKMGAFLE